MKDVNINCSFCGKEIECPKNMLNAKKHACYECFMKIVNKKIPIEEELEKIHIDMPRDKFEEAMPSIMGDDLASTTFSDVWKNNKDRLKERPKKDIAEEMFALGAKMMMEEVLRLEKETERKDKPKK